MKEILSVIAFATLTLTSWAIQVENTAGSLAERITDCEVTHLTITGTMDARDFKFIADSLDQLVEIDLSGVTISPYVYTGLSLTDPNQTFEANDIPSNSFFGKPLTTVILPASLKSIGFAAFAGCTELKSIDLPASIDSIASYAFSASGLTSVSLPASVHALGEGVFSRCSHLTSASLPNAPVGAYTFQSDSLLKSVALGEGVGKVGMGAFSGCTSMKELKMSSNPSIAIIEREAFMNSGIGSLDLSAMPQLTTLGDWALATSAVKEVKLPGSITSIGEGAFFYDDSLVTVCLPMNLQEVSNYAFAGCSAINGDSILTEGNKYIGDFAFYNCSHATNFLIPGTVKYIGTQAMAGMTGLETITALPPMPPALGDSVWAGVNQPGVKLVIPVTIKVEEYAQANQWKEFHLMHGYLLGDVNRDGKVDNDDVTTLIDYILGNASEPFDKINADINEDGIYNVSDVTGIINIAATHSKK